MANALELLEDLLLHPSASFEHFRAVAADEVANSKGVAQAKARAVQRLGLALRDLPDGLTGTADIAVLLRQVIRAHNRWLSLHPQLWVTIDARRYATNLRTVDEADEYVTIVADDWQPSWLPDAGAIDHLTQRRHDEAAPGDGILYSMDQFITYQSEAQKYAVMSALFAPAGSTTLVTLPTGAGKSLCVLLPAWVASRGGRIPGGTTIVVTPTVSLALDQEIQAQRFFRNALGIEYRPLSRTGSTPAELRATIRKALRAGTLPVLFTSPETLIGGELYDICLEAAANGKLNRLVIDEAHLVQTWGAGFRAEFQFLGTFRRKLLAASGGQLRTLLLSATVSDECDDFLQARFSETGNFNKVRGNRLRPEMSYWFNNAQLPEERESRILEAVSHLPRPLILYVTQPSQAEHWLRLLRNEGFLRAATFSGETESDERGRILDEWNSDRRDIMIATSAFGLGVDKPDVRSVVHACLPENLNRFYQEVGRGGRDGCSSISLLCTTPGDEHLARSMTRTFLITSEQAAKRWQGMYDSLLFATDRGDLVTVDRDAPPPDEPGMRGNLRNREWNEHTLLLMQRAGLIEITETRDESLDTLIDEPEGDPLARIQLGALSPKISVDVPALAQLIDVTRKSERRTVSKDVQDISELVSLYSTSSASSCLAHNFAAIFPGAALACGGCPFCRSHSIEPYARSIPISLHYDRVPGSHPTVSTNLTKRMGKRKVLNVTWEGDPRVEALVGLVPLLASLVAAGFQQLVLPEPFTRDFARLQDLMLRLSNVDPITPHILLSDEAVKAGPLFPMFSLPTVIVYSPVEYWADRLHIAMPERLQHELKGIPRINIVHSGLYLESERGLFLNRVNGITIGSSKLEEFFVQDEEFVLF